MTCDLGPLHISPVDRAGPLPRSRLTPISFVKLSMRSYEKAGQLGYGYHGFYNRDLVVFLKKKSRIRRVVKREKDNDLALDCRCTVFSFR